MLWARIPKMSGNGVPPSPGDGVWLWGIESYNAMLSNNIYVFQFSYLHTDGKLITGPVILHSSALYIDVVMLNLYSNGMVPRNTYIPSLFNDVISFITEPKYTKNIMIVYLLLLLKNNTQLAAQPANTGPWQPVQTYLITYILRVDLAKYLYLYLAKQQTFQCVRTYVARQIYTYSVNCMLNPFLYQIYLMPHLLKTGLVCADRNPRLSSKSTSFSIPVPLYVRTYTAASIRTRLSSKSLCNIRFTCSRGPAYESLSQKQIHSTSTCDRETHARSCIPVRGPNIITYVTARTLITRIDNQLKYMNYNCTFQFQKFSTG